MNLLEIGSAEEYYRERAKQIENVMHAREKFYEREWDEWASIFQEIKEKSRELESKIGSERKRKAEMETDLQLRSESLQENTEILAALSHETRNFLVGMEVLVNALKNGSDEIDIILPAVETTIDHLLRFSNHGIRLTKSKLLEQNQEWANLVVALETSSYFQRRIAEKKGLRFELKIQEGFPKSVYIDLGKVRLIFQNLVRNAIQNTFDGAINVELQYSSSLVTSDSGKVQVSLSIRDTGKGFDIYHRSGPKRTDSESSGFGLRIVRELLDAMGASMEVNTSAAGSEFKILFPEVAVDL